MLSLNLMTRDNQGYKKLIIWKNLSELRALVYGLLKDFPYSEIRRKIQMNDAARSAKQNFAEGYAKSTGEFIQSQRVSLGSLEELSGDLNDCLEDGLITKLDFDKADKLCGTTSYLMSRLIEKLGSKYGPN